MSYSGPTYVAIRSGKHSSSTAFSHSLYMEKLFQLSDFDTITKTADKQIKSVVIITVDGGPDENPKYLIVINTALHHFVDKNFDALFIACNECPINLLFDIVAIYVTYEAFHVKRANYPKKIYSYRQKNFWL